MNRTFSLSSSVLASCLCTPLGWSQTVSTSTPTQADGAPPIESVVISAEKRGVTQNAQSVPLSLTVINDVDIEQRHALDLRDLTTAAPNVTLTEGIPGYAMFSIRGLGVNTTIPSMEPAVGVFVDGIYLGMSAGAVLDLVDLENVEILRGPQGLLFGRNTTGGAILLNTRRPGDAFAVYGSVNYETGPQEIVSGRADR